MDRRYLTFQVAKAAYGIPDTAFGMYLCDKTLDPRPAGTPPAVVGTFNLAHREFLILSLRRLFGLPDQKAKQFDFVWIKLPQGTFGIVVDTMDDALSFEGVLMSEAPEDTIVEVLESALPYIKTVVSGHAQGVPKYVRVLDLELLFAQGTVQAA